MLFITPGCEVMLLDAYGRPTYNLRISVTSKCNLKCIFCHAEGNDVFLDQLNPEGIEKVTKVASSYGVRKVKITGGEPLIRKDIVEIVNRVASVEDIQEVSMVTNATLLEPLAGSLKKAGLKRLNVNIPSLKHDKYRDVTKGNLDSALKGVEAAVRQGLNPVKINMVLLKGINDGELDDYIKFASSIESQLQVIELEPLKIKKGLYDRMHLITSEIEEYLERKALRSWARESMQRRRVFDLGTVLVEVVHPVENTEFCAYCNRIRLTSDGTLKPCLMKNGNKIMINDILKSGDHSQLVKAYLRSIMQRKPYYVAAEN